MKRQPKVPKHLKHIMSYISADCLLADSTKCSARIKVGESQLTLARLLVAERDGLDYYGPWKLFRLCDALNCLNLAHYKVSRSKRPGKKAVPEVQVAPEPTPSVEPTPCPHCEKYIDLIATLGTAAQLFTEAIEEAINASQK